MTLSDEDLAPGQATALEPSPLGLTPEQLAMRSQGLGASDAPQVCGLSKFGNPLRVYLDKVGLLEREPMTPEQEWGLRHEETVARAFQDKTGLKVEPCGETLVHMIHPWLFATPDRLVGGVPLELKTAASAEGWGESGTDQAREDYLIQLCCQMMVLGADHGWLAVLIGLSDFRWYPVERNDRLCGLVLGILRDFWNRVQHRQPPEPDWTDPRTPDLVELLHRPTPGTQVPLEGYAVTLLDAYQRYSEAKSELARQQDEAKARLCEMMGTAEQGVLPDGRVITRKLVEVPAREAKAYSYTNFTIKKGRKK